MTTSDAPISRRQGFPRDRLAALRTAFAATLKDPGVAGRSRQNAARHDLPPTEALEAFRQELYATPPELIREIQEIVPSP